MAGDRRINWGADATDARYRTEDTGNGANFVVAEDLDGQTVLLEYDDSATPSEWKVRGPVEMNSNDISGVGTITASTVNTDELTVNEVAARIYQTSAQTISTGTVTTVAFDSSDDYGSGDVLTIDTANNKITIEKAGVYTFDAAIGYVNPDDQHRCLCRVKFDATKEASDESPTSGAGVDVLSNPAGITEVVSPPVDVTVETFQDSGTSKDTNGSEPKGYLDVGRLG